MIDGPMYISWLCPYYETIHSPNLQFFYFLHCSLHMSFMTCINMFLQSSSFLHFTFFFHTQKSKHKLKPETLNLVPSNVSNCSNNARACSRRRHRRHPGSPTSEILNPIQVFFEILELHHHWHHFHQQSLEAQSQPIRIINVHKHSQWVFAIYYRG